MAQLQSQLVDLLAGAGTVMRVGVVVTYTLSWVVSLWAMSEWS